MWVCLVAACVPGRRRRVTWLWLVLVWLCRMRFLLVGLVTDLYDVIGLIGGRLLLLVIWLLTCLLCLWYLMCPGLTLWRFWLVLTMRLCVCCLGGLGVLLVILLRVRAGVAWVVLRLWGRC